MLEKNLCSACLENPRYKDSEECAECLRGFAEEQSCDCGRIVHHDLADDWIPSDPTEYKNCETCERNIERVEKLEALENEFRSFVESVEGWSFSNRHLAQTSTRYYDIDAECSKCNWGLESWKVRLGDHPTAHCSEDFSFSSGEAGGDDHDFEKFKSWVAKKKPICEDCQN